MTEPQAQKFLVPRRQACNMHWRTRRDRSAGSRLPRSFRAVVPTQSSRPAASQLTPLPVDNVYTIVYTTIGFEWDPAKAVSNRTKHGVDFVDALRMFEGPVLLTPDTRRDYVEKRVRVIGLVDGRALAVLFTMRGNNCRLISARRASRRERKAYRQAHPDAY